MTRVLRTLVALWLTTLAQYSLAADDEKALSEIPSVPVVANRRITLQDLLQLRDIDALSVSTDGSHFAILLRQAVPAQNAYRTGWFVGSAAGGSLTFVGDGGEPRLVTFPNGTTQGEIAGGPGRWSPDGLWLVYPVQRAGQIQLWRSRRDGQLAEQLTHNSADVRDFVWSDDGEYVYFSVGPERARLRERELAEARAGYHFDDFRSVGEIVNPGHPPRALPANPPIWTVEIRAHMERPANSGEQRAFERSYSGNFEPGVSGPQLPDIQNGAAARPVLSATGAVAWLAPSGPDTSGPFPEVRVTASTSAQGAPAVACLAPECSGRFIEKLWWTADGKQILFWNEDQSTGWQSALYAWSPSTGSTSVLVPLSQELYVGCAVAAAELLCLHETPTQPRHVVAINTVSGAVTVLADVNPEFKNLDLGRVEEIEWPLPSVVPGLYPKSVRGFVLYPPDFEPDHKYPVFIAPYSPVGFQRGDVGDEHPLLVYAANGIVVIHTGYPNVLASFERSAHLTPSELVKLQFSRKDHFPYFTTMMHSTTGALDLVAKRGFIDLKRVGIGGISQATDNPLYVLFKEDRIAAASVAGGYYGLEGYYGSTPSGRRELPDWFPPPFGAGLQWWREVDVAAHVGEIKAPILFNIADQEFYWDTFLLRCLEDAHKPFDAYIFPQEYHEKWQPAHRAAVYRRNLDWFRFWLQDYEDPDQSKLDQYERWRALRKLKDTPLTKALHPRFPSVEQNVSTQLGDSVHEPDAKNSTGVDRRSPAPPRPTRSEAAEST
jgi:dipeptidyl aminopeptidase/acylaminoacyl peptidase